MGRVHDIMLMIDLGDLREGIWPNDLMPTVEQILELKGVRIAGIGTNLGCFGAIMPTPKRISASSSPMPTRPSGCPAKASTGSRAAPRRRCRCCSRARLPAGINNLRVGEAILQGGVETFRDTPWDELEPDACRLTSDIIEVKLKPSRPIGQSGYDAFGNQPVFPDEGDRLRAIANIGREDVLVEGLTPIAKGVRVLGASSDHLLLDVADADPPPAVGDRVAFRMSYGAMLMAMTSEYVEKAPMHDVEDFSGRKMVSISAEPAAAGILAREGTGARLEAMNFDVVELADVERPPSGLIRLTVGADRRIAHKALAATARATHSFGLIWIDSIAALMPEDEDGIDLPEGSVLARALGLDHKAGRAAAAAVAGKCRHRRPAPRRSGRGAGAEGFARLRLHHDRHRRHGHARRDARGDPHRHLGHARLSCQLFADGDRIRRLGGRLRRHDGARDASGDGGDRALRRAAVDGCFRADRRIWSRGSAPTRSTSSCRPSASGSL